MYINLELSPEFLSAVRGAVKAEIDEFKRVLTVDLDLKLLTLDEVAEFMQISKPQVRKYMQLGLPHFQEGQIIRFQKSEVIEWTRKTSI